MIKTLKDTLELMNNADYKERFVAVLEVGDAMEGITL